MRTNFMKLITVMGTVLTFFYSGLAQVKDAPPATDSKKETSKIQFDDPVYDFGKVNSGEVVKHEFVFTNIGTATLEIKDVRPGCGCTTAGTWDKLVEPGKTGKIPLPGQSNVTLQIKGTVWKAIDVTPTMAVFNVSSESQTNETKVVRIVNNQEESIELSDLTLTNQTFKAELKTVKPGKEFELQITAVPPFNSPSIIAPISLKTTSAKVPTINVTAYVVVQQPVTVMPSQITLPAGPFTNVVHHVVTIRSTGTNSLVLSDAAVNAPGATVKVQETQPGRFFSLSVDFPEGFQIQPGQNVEVSVKSNHPKFPLIKVPVYQSQRPISPARTAV